MSNFIKTSPLFSAVCWALAVGLLPVTGCASARQKREERLAQAAVQRDNYNQLLTDLQNKAVEKGASQAMVEKKYGSPSSVFRSGSTEIWIFRDMKENAVEDDTTPIRLYFENDRLLVWHY